MNILWVTNTVYPYRRKVLELIGCEHDLTLVTLGTNHSVGGVTHSNRLKKNLYRVYIPFRTLLRMKKFDYIVVTGWDAFAYILTLRIANFLRIPNSMIFESTLDSSIHKVGLIASIRRYIFKQASTVITLSKLSREAASVYCGDLEKLVDSKNWFDPENFPFISKSVTKDGYVFIYLGRLIPQKGIVRMIEAFYEIAEPLDRLVIVGEGPEKMRVKELCTDDRVTFVGAIPHTEISGYFAEADALIFPTYNDVYGFPCLEALSCGLGVVVSKQAGIWRDIHEFSGVVVFENDLPKALIEIKETKLHHEYIDLTDFHYENVLVTIQTAYRKSQVFFHSE